MRYSVLNAVSICLVTLSAFAAGPEMESGNLVPFVEAARANLGAAQFQPGKLKLPLVVTERCGVARKEVVVSGGVPFPPGFLPDVKRLRVIDGAGKPVVSQASLMVKWHKPAYDDSVQWALVSFPASVAANGTATYYLVDDEKVVSPRSSMKVSEAEGAIIIETGAAKFVVPKTGNKLISEAFFAGIKVIGGEGLRGQVTSGDWPDRELKAGTRLLGECRDVQLEENGPARVVVRARGTFAPGDKDKLYYGFTARMYFSAGSSSVRILYVIDNSRLDPKLVDGWRRVYAWPIDDASLIADVVSGDAVSTLAEGKLIGGNALTIHQDSSGGDKWKALPGGNYERWLAKYTKGKEVKGVSFRGYKVTLGDRDLAAGNAHLGVIDVSGAKAGLSAALRNFRVEYPSALSGSKTQLRVGLFPRECSENFHVNTGQRESWDIKLLLHAAAKPDLKALHAEHDGLFLFRVEPSWMVRAAACGAWPSGLAILQGKAGAPRRDKSKLDGISVGWDWYGWIGSWNSGGGHWNQSTAFAPWVLWGNGANFDVSESKALWASDVCAMHYGDEHMASFWLYLRSWNWHENRLKGHTPPGYYNRNTWGLPDSGHMGMFMWLEYYLLTGDMRARESSEALGVRARAFCWKDTHTDKRDGTGPLRGGIGWCKKKDPDKDPKYTPYNRYIGWPLYDLAQYYRLTGRPELLEEASVIARGFRNTGRMSPTGFLCAYINKKGNKSMYGGQGPFGKYRDLSASACYAHFQMGIMVSGLVEYYRVSRDMEALDVMTGFSDFMTHHAMLKDPEGKKRGWIYTYADYWGPNSWEDLGAKPKASFFASNFRVIQPMGAIYGFTGRQDHYEVMKLAMASLKGRTRTDVIAGHMAVDHPKKDNVPPEKISDLSVEKTGDGKYVLRWSAPEGAPAWYQVKYSTSPILERVSGWPDRSEPLPADKKEWHEKVKTFQKKHVAFWQARNIDGEPNPAKPGTKHEMTVSGLPVESLHFAVKSYDLADNMSALSNVVGAQ